MPNLPPYPTAPRRLELPIGPALAGLPVDLLLKRHLGLSGTVVRRIKWLPDGILVDGQRVNTRFVPQAGQTLSVRLSDPQRRSGILPAPGPLDIVYEDQDLIVLNKAPGVPVHPGPGHFSDTLGNFLLHYYDLTGVEADFHPVHRLDRGTSGLLVAAKHPHAQEVLKGQLHTPAFRRVYLAVCEGVPQPAAGWIDAPIGPRDGSLVEQMVRPDGKPARTRYETLAVSGGRALLRLTLDTGRTHQIRVHMAHLGHPLTGDFLYGQEVPHLIPRPALHSAQLTFCHPISGAELAFSLPLPRDMENLLGSPPTPEIRLEIPRETCYTGGRFCSLLEEVVNMSYRDTYEAWLASSALSHQEKEELEAIRGDDKEIEARFFDQLSFGTAGLRGVMGTGLYRMNIHVIRHATQAFAQVILEEGPQAAARGVAICFDCRNNSQRFAQEAACVIAGNGIPVRLFDALRPTPELSFAVREYGCIAGINITASHNPKEYNGYKVYWEDGAQLPPKHADQVAKKMKELDVFACVKTMDYDKAVEQGRITLMGAETDEKFLSHVMAQANDPAVVAQVADTFRMVYTPFHGTGYRLIPEALRRLGLKHVICVPQQMVLDGNFPTVASPNPENPEGFALAVDIANQEGADFILGSDPDADRVGIMVRTGDGAFQVISGNQTGVLLLDYLIGAMRRAGTLPQHPIALKTIVTTEMARKVAEVNGLQCFDTFTGFKFLAQKKDQLEADHLGKVILSYEESYGYMLGDYVRDKDAVTASLLLAEMAAWYASQGMTLYDALLALYQKYGYYGEKTLNLVMPGLDGLKKMEQLMADLRKNPPAEIAGVAVVQQKDYLDGSVVAVATGARTSMELSGSNVLRYELADHTSLIVRPSGTEPKVKVYILANGDSQAACDDKVLKYSAWAEGLKR